MQSMPDVSPTKWHRAHTTWFFETFLLEPALPGYQPFDEHYRYLFNSYYEARRAPARPRRARPSHPARAPRRSATTAHHVDDSMHVLLDAASPRPTVAGAGRARPAPRAAAPGAAADGHQARPVASTPTQPHYGTAPLVGTGPPSAGGGSWTEHDGGIVEIGHDGDGLRLRQRGAPPPAAAAAVRDRRLGW